MALDERILAQYRVISDAHSTSVGELQRAYYRHRAVLATVERHCSRGRLLDIGAGWAVESRVLSTVGYEITVLDSSETNAGYQGRFDGLPFQTIDANVERGIPSSDAQFDSVLFLDVIEHLRDSPKPVFAEIRRVLKPGGCVIFATPNVVELRKRLYMAAGKSFMPSLDYVWNTPYHADHHREYTPEEVAQVFRWAGLTIAEHRTVDTFWPMSLRSFRGLGRGRRSENLSRFDVAGRWYRPYDWAKQPFRLAASLFPRLRDMIVTVGVKTNGG